MILSSEYHFQSGQEGRELNRFTAILAGILLTEWQSMDKNWHLQKAEIIQNRAVADTVYAR